MLKDPNRLGYYISQTPVPPLDQIEHTEEQPNQQSAQEQPPHEPTLDPTYIDTAGEMPVVPPPSGASNTLTNWYTGVPQEQTISPMVKPENWHSGLPNPSSYTGLSNEPPYWQPRRPIDLATIEKWGFRILLFPFIAGFLYTSALAGIFLWKLLWEVVAIK